MPSHQERIRLKNLEMNCKHIWIYLKDSGRAPFILKDGSRETIKVCFTCGIKENYIRSQEKFEQELNQYFSCINKFLGY